jgi:hypothetical protein
MARTIELNLSEQTSDNRSRFEQLGRKKVPPPAMSEQRRITIRLRNSGRNSRQTRFSLRDRL